MERIRDLLQRIKALFIEVFEPAPKKKKHHKAAPKWLRYGILAFFALLVIGIVALVSAPPILFFGASGEAYQTALEALIATLSEGNYLGDDWPRYVYQTYAGANPFVAFDIQLLLVWFFHSFGFSVVLSAKLAFIGLSMGTSALLYHLLSKTNLNLAWKIVAPLIYVVLMVLTAMLLSPQYIGLMVYYPLFLWAIGRFYQRQPWIISLFVVVLAIQSPTTFLVSLAVFAVIFAIESAKRSHPSATDWIVELFRFLLFAVIGVVVSIVVYYEALIHVLHSTYGSVALITDIRFLGTSILIYPINQFGVSFMKLFHSSRTETISGFRVFYSLQYWIVLIGFLATSVITILIAMRKKFASAIVKIEALFDRLYESPKKTIIAIALIVFTFLFGIQISIILFRNSFYNNFSDDIIQYYSIISDFIAQIKSGSLSWYNLNNYFGASFFSDVYYVPLDIFTLGTFITSFVMPTELAYSIFELVKIWAGVMVFAYYLHTQGMKTRTVFWMAMVYFVSGGTVSFMAFPVFLSLVFYLPLGLVVIGWFFKGKAWVVPLYVMALVFYDFYLGYMALAFVSFLFIIEYLKRPNFKLGKFLVSGASYLGLLLLGVALSAVILYPSILFILEDTYRPDGFFDAWVIEIGLYKLKLFQPEIYIRILAKIFTEQKAIGFYGFENHYGQEHISLFITIVGFTYMNYIFFMKGRISRVYQWAIGVGIVMMIFPIFSYVLSATTDSPYTRWINMLPIVQTMILAHVFDRYGFEQVKMKNLTIPIVLSLGALAFVFQYYLKRLGTDENFVSRDVLTADMFLMGFAAVVMIVILVFGWLKKHQWIKRAFWVEFVIAIVYIYTGPFAIANKIDTFQSMRSIDEFLVESIDEDEFFRVYVDLYRFDIERLNFNRMTTFPTNTEIFHSWTDEATNEISLLLYQAREYQTKDKMTAQAIYLNHVLGYKYMLLDATKNYVLDSAIFTLINQNAQYKLYEIHLSEPFQVYESFLTNAAFEAIAGSANRIAVQKLLLLNVLLAAELDDVQLIETSVQTPESMQTAAATNSISEATLVQDVANGTQYYRYSNEDFKIGFSSGAIYIKSTWLNPEDYGRVYVEFADMTQRECEVVSDQSHQVKCEFWQEPTYIFFEKNARFNSLKVLQYRLEAAIDSAAYLVYNFPENAFDRTTGLVYFNLSSGTKLERVFFTDAAGVQTEAFEGYYYFSGSLPTRLYVYKTNDMYKQSNPFNMNIRYVYDDLTDYLENAEDKIADNQSMTIKNGLIRLSYTRTSATGNDQIVMIPVAYSEEWTVQNATYRTTSVSGGFLGVVIPHGETDIDISIRFVPKGLKLGALGTLGAAVVYAAIFAPRWIILAKRKNKGGIAS